MKVTVTPAWRIIMVSVATHTTSQKHATIASPITGRAKRNIHRKSCQVVKRSPRGSKYDCPVRLGDSAASAAERGRAVAAAMTDGERSRGEEDFESVVTAQTT